MSTAPASTSNFVATTARHAVPRRLFSLGGFLKLFLGAVVLVGLFCLYAGTRMLVADIAAYQASVFVSDWHRRGAVPSDRAWQIAEGAANRAVAVAPVGMAENYDRLGRVHEWHHQASYFGDPAADDSRRAALDAYRRAVELRPLWPYDWVRLAFVKLSLLEVDVEFDHALRQAAELGPWRLRSNTGIAEIGFTAWHELDSGQRTLVLEAARRVVAQNQREGNKLLELANRLQRADDICAVLGDALVAKQPLCSVD